jgi:hypothetical protein
VSGTIIEDISDHFFTLFQPNMNKTNPPNATITKRIYSKKNLDKLRLNLSECDWEEVISSNDVNTAYNSFLGKLSESMESCIPMVKQKLNRNIHKVNQFMTKGLIKSRSVKLQLQKISINSPTLENVEKYKRYRNLFNKLVRIRKKEFTLDTLDKNRKNPKKTWEILKDLTGTQKNTDKVTEIKIGDKLSQDPKLIAEEFNTFLQGQGKK